MTNLADRKAALEAASFREQHNTKKVTLFCGRQSAIPIYLKNGTAALHIAIPPSAQKEAERITDSMSLDAPKEFHNSNMIEFPARRHTGKGETRFGYTVSFQTLGQMKDFAARLDDAMKRKLGS